MHSRVRLILLSGILLVTASPAFPQRERIRERLLSRSVPEGLTPPAPDYNNIHNWASHPGKHDMGDSIPQPLLEGYSYDTTVDVFFIHPTTYIRKLNNQMNADVNNEVINDSTDKRTILYQASAFNEYRLFAPRYRQANFSAYLGKQEKYQPVFDTAYADIKNAFLFYIKNWNNGRPFFIASHSQGSQHAVRLISELIQGTDLEKKLIAAYIIGMPPVKSHDLTIPVCKDSTQTGCYIAWNSFDEDFTPRFNLGKIELNTVNPLTWTTLGGEAAKSLHKGALGRDFSTIKSQALSASIKSGRLLISADPELINIPERIKNLHVMDIGLFYVDIRENLKQRVNSYRKRI